MKHALVVGCSGIVGLKLVDHLLLHRDWKVTGIARKDFPLRPERLNLVTMNISEEKDLKKLASLNDVTHIFYVVWCPCGTDEECCKCNKKMFQNVLTTVQQSSKCLQYVYLQTGTKYYGMHVGPEKGMTLPYREDNERLPSPHFQYELEDLLMKEAKGKSWTWNIARPPCIIGYTATTPMNIGVTLGIYAAILKELGQPLIFPYGEECWTPIREFIDADLLSRFILWLTPHETVDGKLQKRITANEIFNITNGDYYSMETLWPKIAKFFGMEYQVAKKPFKVAETMRDKEEVWNRIVQKHNLTKTPLKNLVTWEYMDLYLGRSWNEISVLQKTVSAGFLESENTESNFFNFFESMVNMNVLPRNFIRKEA